MAYWLMKSEPGTYAIDDLERAGTDSWDGVRNYQARNHLRAMRRGDQALFYHSSCPAPGVVGIMEIVREAYPDPTALDPQSPYHDPRSTPEAPRWSAVDVRFVRRLRRLIPLAELKTQPALADLPLVRRGNRLSVMPLTREQWQAILALERG